jgi:hypothetical protein
VAIVTERMEMDFKSKKEMWESIAQEYYGAIRVDKKKIDKLRLIWRNNDYNVQEKRLKIKSKFRQQTVSNESYMPGNLYQRATSDSSDTACTENAVNKTERSGKNISINYKCSSESQSGECTLTDFFGNVFGRAVSYAYKDHMRDSVFPCGAESDSTHELCDTNDKNVVPSCKPSTTLAEESECSEQESDTDLLCSNDSEGLTDNSRTNVEKPDDYVYDVAIDQCQCYSSLKEDENEKFLRTPHLLSTVNALSNSNIPSSGTFQAKLVRSVSYVRMSSDWLNIPVKSGDVSAQTSFTGNYTTFFTKY